MVRNLPYPLPRRRHGLLHTIAMVIITLIVLVGVAVLIAWLIIKPKKLVYTMEHASVHNYNLTSDNHLYATFKFTFQVSNPSNHISMNYDSIEISAAFNDQTVAFNTIEPFHQPVKNVTRIDDTLTVKNVVMSGSNAKDLRVQGSLGKIELDVNVKARVRIKVWIWKSNHRTARIGCSSVAVSLSSSKGFQRVDCDADL